MFRKIRYPLTTAALALLFLIVLEMNIWQRPFLEKTFGPEINKMNYQFLVIGILGGLVSTLYRMWSKAEEKLIAERSERDRARHQHYSDFNRGVNRLLKLKFTADAKVVQDNKTVLHKEYHLIMSRLTDLMLRFRTFQTSIESRHEDLYADPQRSKLFENLNIVVEYLNNIVNEYDLKSGNTGAWSGDPLTCQLDSLPCLREFYRTGSEFESKLAGPLNKCLAELHDAALKSEARA